MPVFLPAPDSVDHVVGLRYHARTMTSLKTGPRDRDRAGLDVIEWLLEPDNPSVRYFTQTRLLGMPETHKGVRQARRTIMQTGLVPELLARQCPGGFWDRADRFYHAKYRGTVWQIMILAEHAASPADPHVKQACEFILGKSQDRTSGGFAMHEAVRTSGGRPLEVIPCLTGNMTWSLLRLGYAQDPRTKRAIYWLTRFLRFDDGESSPPEDFPYNHWEMCYGRHSCLMGIVKGLKALSELPAGERPSAVRRCVRDCVEFLLRHHVFKRSHNLKRQAKPGWRRFGFPRMWGSDVLEVLTILSRLGIRDSRMQEAIDLVASRQNPDGRWTMDDSLNDRFLVPVEALGRPSKWITLTALYCLQRWRAAGPSAWRSTCTRPGRLRSRTSSDTSMPRPAPDCNPIPQPVRRASI
jgi:hypothetical protein